MAACALAGSSAAGSQDSQASAVCSPAARTQTCPCGS